MAKPNRKKKSKKNAFMAGKPRTPAEIEQENKPQPNQSARGGRETIDALVVAFVLAFLIRTFQAEQFVIPTGSMAPTLMGRHMDVHCAECGERFKVNASDESTETAQKIIDQRREQGKTTTPSELQKRLAGIQCVGGTCPQCGYVMPFRSDGLTQVIAKGSPPVEEQTNYGGDRIVVRKYIYSLTDPDRWDVVVFKYPGDARQNYIKRLVGLPDEELRIYQGDLFTRSAGVEGEPTIERKPADKVLALRQLVHDTDYDPVSLYSAGWPLRWQAESEAWKTKTEANGKVIEQVYQGKSTDQTSWLRYRHTLPNDAVWRKVLASDGKLELSSALPKPSLITDYVAYNSGLTRTQVQQTQGFTNRPRMMRDFSNIGVHWTGDLSLDATVQIESDSGTLSFDLVEAGSHYLAEIDIASGTVKLLRQSFNSEEQEEIATGQTSITGKGSHQIRFANVDDQLHLWVDDQLVSLDGRYEAAETLSELAQQIPQTNEQDAGDLAPVGIGIAEGAVRVDRMQVWRDIYYLAERWESKADRGDFVTDFDLNQMGLSNSMPSRVLINIASDPTLWSYFADRKYVDFRMNEDQFFVMGDNSAASLDARLWTGGSDSGKPGGPYLERHLLVGEALCVYWPHSWYPVPFTGKRIPAWPNFGDMRIVR